MAAQPNRTLKIQARSEAESLACIALADISKTLGDGALDYRLIGGNMVNLHVHRWGLQDQFPRMTLDADVGMPKAAMRHLKLQETFAPLGYEKEKGDRITRPVPGYRERAAIDFLVSESTSRTRQNRAVGELIVSEAENLAAVFRHPGIEVELQMELLHSEQTLFASALRLPDEASAFVLKVGAFQKRYGGNDAEDIWRLAHVLHRAGLSALRPVSATFCEAVQSAKTLFQDKSSSGARSLKQQKSWHDRALAQALTPLRAILQSLADEVSDKRNPE